MYVSGEQRRSVMLLVAPMSIAPFFPRRKTQITADHRVTQSNDCYLASLITTRRCGHVTMFWPMTCKPNVPSSFFFILSSILKSGISKPLSCTFRIGIGRWDQQKRQDHASDTVRSDSWTGRNRCLRLLQESKILLCGSHSYFEDFCHSQLNLNNTLFRIL